MKFIYVQMKFSYAWIKPPKKKLQNHAKMACFVENSGKTWKIRSQI